MLAQGIPQAAARQHFPAASPQGPAAPRRAEARQSRSQAPQAPAAASATSSQGGGLLQKLGNVLREKVSTDVERVYQGTSKTRERLGVVDELLAYWTLQDSEDTLEQLEDALITADFGPKTALKVVDGLRDGIRAGKLTSKDLKQELKASLVALLTRHTASPALTLGSSQPGVVLVVGVNGGGKTTTIGKLAFKLRAEGVRVLLAAGDTFRAAAAEQLAGWAERAGSGVEVVLRSSERQRPDALLGAATLKAVDEAWDVLLCDTSGRLHNNLELMEELERCKKAIGRRLRGAPHEVLLVLDGTTGLNMLAQAREFTEAVGVTGFVLTKLDGTARGGAVVSVVDELQLPVKFVGVGERVQDLQPFDASAFVDALFPVSPAGP